MRQAYPDPVTVLSDPVHQDGRMQQLPRYLFQDYTDVAAVEIKSANPEETGAALTAADVARQANRYQHLLQGWFDDVHGTGEKMVHAMAAMPGGVNQLPSGGHPCAVPQGFEITYEPETVKDAAKQLYEKARHERATGPRRGVPLLDDHGFNTVQDLVETGCPGDELVHGLETHASSLAGVIGPLVEEYVIHTAENVVAELPGVDVYPRVELSYGPVEEPLHREDIDLMIAGASPDRLYRALTRFPDDQLLLTVPADHTEGGSPH